MITIVYLLLFIAFIFALGIFNSARLEHRKINVHAPFKKKWANLLYKYSYYMPFVWFIDEKETSQQTKVIKRRIALANLSQELNYRSFTTLRVGILIACVVFYGFILLLMKEGGTVAQFLFNIHQVDINGDSQGSLTKVKIGILLILAVIAVTPSFVLNHRVKTYSFYRVKDIPIVQLFIIMMLRAKKPVGDILFALSKINTRYKEIFDTGYRMFLRNKDEGLDYISESFGETDFNETIKVLREMGEYSREDSIKLLENNMKQLLETNNAKKRGKDLGKLVFSQATIAIPFISVVTLCLVPLAVYGIHLFNTAGYGF